MKSRQTILESFPDHLFWDVDRNSLDIHKDSALVIPRLLFATTESTFEEDVARLELLYPPDQIVNTLKELKSS